MDPSKECVCGQAVTGRGLSEKEHSSSWAADGPRSGERSIDPDTPSRGRQEVLVSEVEQTQQW